jgi:hypothetical protein
LEILVQPHARPLPYNPSPSEGETDNDTRPGVQAGMNPGSQARGLPSWRLLAALGLAVFAMHLLVLKAAPARLGPAQDPDSLRAKAFVTRSIAPRPVPEAAPPKPPKPAQARPARPAKPRPAVKIEPNQPLAQADQAQAAISSIANPDIPATAEQTSTAASTTTVTVAEPSAPPTSTPTAAAASAGPTPTVVTAVTLPASVRLQYKMTGSAKGLDYHANAELNWNNSGREYEASMRVSAMFIGSRTMNSRGDVTPAGLAPRRFSDKSRSEQAAHFETDKGKITFSANTPDAPWLEGAQDRVSIFLQLGGMLAAASSGAPGATPFPVGSSITVYTVGPREADTWTFIVEGEEQSSLPAGDMATVKLTRKPRREYDQKVEIWYAPALYFLPVRSRITQANGDFIDQQLSSAAKP